MRRSPVVFVVALLLLPTLATPREQDGPRADEDDVLLIVTFSGGGTRAAAFGFGVAQAMRETAAGNRSFIDRIDRVAGVSGGSLIATQLAVDDSAPGLASFRQKVLMTNIEAELVKSAAESSLKLVRNDYNRSDAAAGYYGALFGDKTLADLEGGEPELWVQATEMISGRPLAFRPAPLGDLGLTSDQVSVGEAIAASAAVPGALPPLNLQIPSEDGSTSLPLADGGVVDNLGLEALFRGDVPEHARAVIVIVVNSRRTIPLPWKPENSGLISAGYSVALQQRRLDDLMLESARAHLRVLELESRLAGRELETRLLVLGFEGSARKQALDQIGTRFNLSEEEVLLLVDEGREQTLARLPELSRYWERQDQDGLSSPPAGRSMKTGVPEVQTGQDSP
jgi:predicted acylesterase/phospholipase RssA